jgi:hypothetical protein
MDDGAEAGKQTKDDDDKSGEVMQCQERKRETE